MSKFFHLSKKPKKVFRKRKFLASMEINLKTANIVVSGLIVVMTVGYLVQINSLATKGYQIKDLENKITSLKQEKADLELEALSLQSMGNVAEKVQGLGMVSAGEPEYLAPTPVAMAR